MIKRCLINFSFLGINNVVVVVVVVRYTEHSTVGLAQQWDQLDQLCVRMQRNLEQQIQARNMTGVSEENLREFTLMFKLVNLVSSIFNKFESFLGSCYS